MSSQKERRRLALELQSKNVGMLKLIVRGCEVPGCGKSPFDAHHMSNPGLAMKDHDYRNLFACCHEHHMELEAKGKQVWARKYFAGHAYEQVVQFVRWVRACELAALEDQDGPELPQELSRLLAVTGGK